MISLSPAPQLSPTPGPSPQPISSMPVMAPAGNAIQPAATPTIAAPVLPTGTPVATSNPLEAAANKSPDWITGNQPGPYTPGLPGSYGGNAAVRAWQIQHADPKAMANVTIQLSPHFPKTNPQGFMADVLGYAVVDHFQLDRDHDGEISGPELAYHFSQGTMEPAASNRLAQSWLRAHDVNQNGKIDAIEHAATILMEMNAQGFTGYFQDAMEAASNAGSQAGQAVQKALAQAFYHAMPYNVPENRNSHHAAMFTQPDMVRTLLGNLIQTFNLAGWLKAFGVGQPVAPTPQPPATNPFGSPVVSPLQANAAAPTSTIRAN